MFGFNKKTKTEIDQGLDKQAIDKLDKGLEKTRGGLFSGISNLFSRTKTISSEDLNDIEDRLLMADVGIEATTRIMDKLNASVKQNRINDGDALHKELHSIMTELLEPVYQPLSIQTEIKPAVIMAVGVNGVGKTTTIGKLAKRIQSTGKSVMLAAGDTFRAAAIEQLTVWGERNNVSVISQTMGADSAAVIFDALESAKAKAIDVVIADTAGRLHTKENLMEELKKVRRVISKFNSEISTEILLVLDATTGQNALMQAKQFHADIGIDGIVLSKLDGTAKGGIIFALANELAVPIRFIGVGEAVDDLKVFEPEPFVSALLNIDP